MDNTYQIYLISDSTGETLDRIFIAIKAQYKIAYLDEDYKITIVARDKLDYVWLMARTKTLPHDQMIKFRDMIEGMGYSLDNYREIEQE